MLSLKRQPLFVWVLLFVSFTGVQPVSAYAVSCPSIFSSTAYDLIGFPKGHNEAFRFIEENKMNTKLLPQINYEQLKNIEDEKIGWGRVNDGLFTALYQGREVFIKIDRANEMTEAYWLSFLNRFDIGPKFFGVTMMNGRPAIVMERIDGLNIKNPGSTGAFITLKMIAEMKRQLAVVYDLGIYPHDPQFMVSKDKVVLIDMGSFEGAEISRSHGPTLNLSRFVSKVEGLLQRWLPMGLLEF